MEKIVFPTNGAKTTKHPYAKMNLNINFTLLTKINSNCIKDLNTEHKTKNSH